MSNNRNTDIQQIADCLKALSNPNRLRIYLRLVTCCRPDTKCSVDEAMRLCIGDLGADMDLAPSTISHHVKELKQAGLISMERSGQKIECWVAADVLAKLSHFFTGCCAGNEIQQLPTQAPVVKKVDLG